MSELRKFVRQVIREARTKQPGDLPQAEILALIDYILTGTGAFDFTEKFAGSHAEILHGADTGEFSSKSKSSRSAGGGWNTPTGKAKQISDQMITLETPSASRRFAFEYIDAINRPDYINYLVGDQPVAVEYSGELSRDETEALNASQELVKFISLEDITYAAFDISEEDMNTLSNMQNQLSASAMKRAELKEIGTKVSEILIRSIPQSLLGGPLEGLMVTSGVRQFKIPNPEYAAVQRLQSPLYAMFSGRGGVSKKEIKSRVLNADSSDRLIQDVTTYLTSIPELPPGFRTFFAADEAEELLDLIDSATTGDAGAGKSLYVQLNRRINDKGLWINT